MPVSDDLVFLIGQLRATTSRRERLKLVARGWRTLKALSPTDRLLVARELGFDGSEALVEQLARRGGASPALVLELLEQAESATPEQIAALMRGASQPDARRTLGTRLVDAAKHWVADLESWDTPPDDVAPDESASEDVDWAEVEPSRQPPDDVPEIVLATAVETPPTLGERVEAVVAEFVEIPPEVDRETDDDEISEPEGVVAVDNAAQDPPPPVQADPPSDEQPAAPREPEPAPPPTELSVDEGGGTIREPTEPEPPIVLSRAGLDEIGEQLSSQRSLTRRLHELAAVAPSLENATADDLRTLLELYPAGWARRRAVQALLRAQVPRSFLTAVALVEQLESPTHRAWALATLMDARRLSEEEIEALLELAPAPAIRRKLRARTRSELSS